MCRQNSALASECLVCFRNFRRPYGVKPNAKDLLIEKRLPILLGWILGATVFVHCAFRIFEFNHLFVHDCAVLHRSVIEKCAGFQRAATVRVVPSVSASSASSSVRWRQYIRRKRSMRLQVRHHSFSLLLKRCSLFTSTAWSRLCSR